MALIDLWLADGDGIKKKSLHQILAFAGEGKLGDGSECSKQFRGLLAAVPLDVLRRFSDEAQNGDALEPGFALQDIVNEVGQRLDFKVSRGLYRGRRGDLGHDGLWADPTTEHSIIAEVKTTSAYRIKLDTIARYKTGLVTAGKVDEEKVSILVIIGREGEDTADLEAQIRGSRQAWDVRVISLDALFQLVALKDKTDDPVSAKLLRGILVPREYTKLDSLLELVSFVSRDIAPEESEDSVAPDQDQRREGAYVSRLDKEELRVKAHQFLTKRFGAIRSTSRTLIETVDGRVGFYYSPSKPYPKTSSIGYWFALHPHQIEFLKAHAESHVSLLCVGFGLLLMPWAEFSKYVESLGESSIDGRTWKHVTLLRSHADKVTLRLRSDAPAVDITRWIEKI